MDRVVEVLREIEELKSKRKRLWNISWETGELLNLLVLLKKPVSILEIGTSNGFSTLWLAKDAPGCIYSIEVRDIADEAKENFKRAGLSNIKLLRGEALKVLQFIDVSFDFVFIDANKREYIDYIKILEMRKLLLPGSIIVADNIISHKTTRDFLKYVESKYPTFVLNIGSGVSISILTKL